MNRNKMIVLNGVIVTFTTLLNAILGMVEVSLFLKYYGSTVNGLIQTGNQVLNYVALIEAGLSAAFLYKMYKPMADNDYRSLSGLYVGFRKSMSHVVNMMLLVSIIVSGIYPLLIKSSNLGYFNMLSIFILLSFKVILPYKVTMVPKYMIVLKEQKYKAEFISGFSRAGTYMAEILLLVIASRLKFDMPIQLLLLCTVGISLLTGIWFEFSMRKLYGNSINNNAEPNITPNKMSKDILVHNISRMVFSSTDNIIISTLGTLDAVTIYSSYNMIVGQVTELAQKFMDGATASMGIKIAHHDDNSYNVYREMISGSLWLGGILCTVFAIMINDFIDLWIGSQYCVSEFNTLLFAMVLYCGIILPCVQVARNACGLYKESRNFTVLQAALNLGITIALVPNLGITGALLGTVIARIAITIPCNYYLVDKMVFTGRKSRWIELIFGYMWLIVLSLLGIQITGMIPHFGLPRIAVFLIKTVLSTIGAVLLYTVYYWVINSGFREFIRRIKGMFIRTYNH